MVVFRQNDTCPVTKQVISGCEVTPNHTLRRLLQSWCTLNASYGIERIPTPKPAINRAQVSKILNAAKSPQQQVECLRKLRSIASENETNKRCMEAAGAVDFLVSVVNNFNSLSFEETSEDGFEITRPGDEALSILYGLQISESGLKNLIMGRNGELIIETLTKVMQGGNDESRAYAVLLLKSMLEVADPQKLISLKQELFSEIVQVLRDQISHKASKAALELLINLCPWGKKQNQSHRSQCSLGYD
ncbi:E3 UBIQUITIN-PROTEIN LIGASE PUB23 [Salix purpurea]|uniref:U-box domain-containing protein n=1 Tax=Salix purpurea TaxID=77065 RepID=A0A9Q0Q1X7_SALPP|nr:E3 UBIQUITIN-PROTEIN LIGASE PUB23 [Salix purpurea]